jgi:hypothetical protein
MFAGKGTNHGYLSDGQSLAVPNDKHLIFDSKLDCLRCAQTDERMAQVALVKLNHKLFTGSLVRPVSKSRVLDGIRF